MWDLRKLFRRKSAADDSRTSVAKIRFSNEADVEKILAYYKENQHQHVHIRERDWYASHAEKGQYMLAENEKGEIIACSGTYDYLTPSDTDGKPSYFEIGSTNFKKGEGSGFGLYPFFIASQVVQAFLQYPPKDMCIANVYDSSPVGRKMLQPIVGWDVIEPNEDILAKFKASKSAEHTNSEPMTWYGTPSQTLPHMARIVADFIAKGKVERPVFQIDPQTGGIQKDKEGNKLVLLDHKTGEPLKETLKFDLSEFSLAKTFKRQVENLAHGQFGQKLENNPHTPLALAREDLRSYNTVFSAPAF